MDDDAPNVFLRLDQDKLEQWNSVLRLMLTQLIRQLERRPDRHSSIKSAKTYPILLLLDEFPLLGKIDVLANALSTLRSKNVTFDLALQSIAQLDAVYDNNTRRTIVDNCQYKVILKVTEPDSQEYLSRLFGTIPTFRWSFSKNFDKNAERNSYGVQVQTEKESLILPHQFATNEKILLHTPQGTFSVCKLPILTLY